MKEQDQHMAFNQQIIRYLAGEMDASEKEQFEALLAADPEKKKEFDSFRKIWDGVDNLAASSSYDLDEEWQLMSKKVDLREDFKKIPDIGIERTTGRKIYAGFMRIAAVLLIGLFVVAGYYMGRQLWIYDSYAVGEGTQEIELPDGSLLTLNSGSSIKFSKRESLKNREVQLTGEAFFEVMKDSTRPFIIDAGPARIEVLGTSFNVNAYPDNEEVEVTVASGLVAMTSRERSAEIIVLNKGNTGVLRKAQKELKLVQSGKVNADAWKTRILEFMDAPLGELTADLSHAYRKEIVLASPELEELTITVSFNKQELDAVLNVVASTLDLEIRKEQDRIILDIPQ